LATVGDALKSTGAAARGDGPRPITVPNDRSTEDRVYRAVARGAGFVSFIILVLIGLFLFWKGLPALEGRGVSYFTTSGYQYTGAHPKYGVLAPMFGTITIALISIVVGVPTAIGCALFLSEYAPIRIRRALVALVDLGAAIPSIIYGIWALHEFQPQIAGVCGWIENHLSFIPIFKANNPPYTGSFFIGGLVVGLMIVPIVTSVSREVFSLTPPGEREGALALGATKAQMIRSVVLPFGRGGLIGASMLGLGRALGETIAVAVILGGSFVVSDQILEHGGTTVAAMIALEFGTGGKLGTAELLMAGFVLFVFTLIVNLAASAIVNRSRSGQGVEL
jgi:phosphate transport system permease protein